MGFLEFLVAAKSWFIADSSCSVESLFGSLLEGFPAFSEKSQPEQLKLLHLKFLYLCFFVKKFTCFIGDVVQSKTIFFGREKNRIDTQSGQQN